jgi:hypothetical protein
MEISRRPSLKVFDWESGKAESTRAAFRKTVIVNSQQSIVLYQKKVNYLQWLGLSLSAAVAAVYEGMKELEPRQDFIPSFEEGRPRRSSKRNATLNSARPGRSKHCCNKVLTSPAAP